MSAAKVTLVTGASRGIGAAVAKALAAEGHAVAVNYVAGEEAADEVVRAVEHAGGRAVAVQADTASEADVLRMFETVEAELGALTGLVNNAGLHGPRRRVDEQEDTDIARVLDVNVRGYFLCAREAVKRMSTKHGGGGGVIVNVSSGAANLGSPGQGVLYATSKGAVNSLTIGLSQEVAGEGIRVNTVAPGMTDTDMPGADRLEKQAKLIPMGRVARPEEIAEAVVWLMSDKASYVAGANLRVGGGRP